MSLVNDGRPIVLKPISIGRAWTYGHEYDRMVSGKSEVHAALKAHAFAPAHLDIWDDLIFHILFWPTIRVRRRALTLK